MSHFFLSLAIISHLLGMPIAQALEQNVSVVPTTVEEEFEWRVLPNEHQEAIPPRGMFVDRSLATSARNVFVMDVDTKKVLWQKNPDDVVPMASITKLMTTLVWFGHQPADGLQHVHTFAPEEDTPEGKELNIPHGEKLTTVDLLRSTLIGSDNDTALALAHTTALPDDRFVELMNEKAQALGMTHATFVDPTGLGAGNTATVSDIALLASKAFENEEIRTAASMAVHEQRTVDTEHYSRVYTTNALLYDKSLQIIAGKTGYIPEAGYCVVVQVREPTSGRDILVVVLGAPDDTSRFVEAKKIIQWIFTHYAWN